MAIKVKNRMLAALIFSMPFGAYACVEITKFIA
jgi:hypothetical protein